MSAPPTEPNATTGLYQNDPQIPEEHPWPWETDPASSFSQLSMHKALD